VTDSSTLSLLFDDVVADVGFVTAAVYGVLWRYIEPSDGLCRASMETMAQPLGLSRLTLLHHLRTLVTSGYIEDTTPEADGVAHAYKFRDYEKYIGVVRHYANAGNQSVRARIAPAGSVPRMPRKKKIPSRVRWLVWERDNFTCMHCGSRRYLTVDHIVPEARGGTLAMDNLQTLCKSCNSKKGTRGNDA
jgi:hypothetical protein